MKIFIALFSIAILFVTLFIAVVQKINAKSLFLNDGKIQFSILSNVICEMRTLSIARKYEESIGITKLFGWKILISPMRLLPTIMQLITQVINCIIKPLEFKTFYYLPTSWLLLTCYNVLLFASRRICVEALRWNFYAEIITVFSR